MKVNFPYWPKVTPQAKVTPDYGIKFPNNDVKDLIFKNTKDTSNYRAELIAIEKALEYIASIKTTSDIWILSDCKSALCSISLLNLLQLQPILVY